MTPLHILFYLFSAVAIFSGIMVVSSRNPVHGVLFLVLTFFAMAGLWIMLHAEFLALILVLVYVGAVMTLFLFVVMMLNVKLASLREGFVRYFLLGVTMVLLIVGLIITAVDSRFSLLSAPAPAMPVAEYSNTADLGSVLYTHYAYPFEIAAVLLLAAIIAAICLTHRTESRRKGQSVSEQIAVRREDRVRVLKMPSEKKP